jgi:hypothetical protein
MRRHFLGDKGFTEQKVPSHFAVPTAPDVLRGANGAAARSAEQP